MSMLPTHILKQQNVTKSRWKMVFEDMMVHNKILIGLKCKHKHILVINEFIKNVCDENEGRTEI